MKILRNTTRIDSITPVLAANSQAFTNTINFVSLADNKATVLSAAGAIGGVVGNINKTFDADNETVAKEKVNVETNLRDKTFEYRHSAALTGTETAAELATANTLTIGFGTDFRITEILPDEAGDLKIVRFKVANFELEA